MKTKGRGTGSERRDVYELEKTMAHSAAVDRDECKRNPGDGQR